MSVTVIHGDMRDVLGKMIAEGKVVQAVVTDPPYHLTTGNVAVDWGAMPERSSTHGGDGPKGPTNRTGRGHKTGFMGKQWDGGDIAFQSGTWRLCFELLPPGGHLLAFGGDRTYHRLATAIEEAGFEIRQTCAWLFGSGFPKNHSVSKAIDKAAGAERDYRIDPRWADKYPNGPKGGEPSPMVRQAARSDEPLMTSDPVTDAARQWEGWGTALKPAMELICLARKPLVGTVAANVLKHGTGALNIDGCRIATAVSDWCGSVGTGQGRTTANIDGNAYGHGLGGVVAAPHALGRWPANVVTDGSDEVVKAFEVYGDRPSCGKNGRSAARSDGMFGHRQQGPIYEGNGSAARFFYSSKADAADRLGSSHPTVKPVDLMRWLVRLITPPGGTVLDPFAGSGTTGMACMAEGIDCIMVEREAEYVADIKARIAHVHGEDTPLFSGVMP